MRSEPFDVALNFVNKRFPNSRVVFLGGSIVRGESTEQSDLDLLIIDDSEKTMSRKCFVEEGWPIETFIYNSISFETFFEGDLMLGNPFVPRMCAESIIIKDDGTAKEIKNEAIIRLNEGPPKWTQDQIDHARFLITDALDDLIGSKNEMEDLFTVSRLAKLVHEFVLRVNQKWTGEGKWIVRALKKYDKVFAEEFSHVFDKYYKNREKDDLVRFIDRLLNPYGGRLFEGYKQ